MSSVNVYLDSRVLVLTDNLEVEMTKGFDGIHTYSDFAGVKQFVDKFFTNTAIKRAILYGKSISELFQVLKGCFQYVEAAGGVIVNPRNEVLMIFRNGKWDLPKGKKERKESDQEAAIREVSEETGIEEVVIIDSLCDTYHVYEMNDKRYLKRTAWYKMKGNTSGLKPQVKEGITGIEWILKSNMSAVFSNSYASVIEVLKLLK
jgi:hypothetical protein